MAMAFPTPLKDPVEILKKGSMAFALKKGSMAFALDLFRKVSEEAGAEKNIVMSPFSFMSALAMVYAGAKENTAAEMKEVMKLTELPDESFHGTFKHFLSTFVINEANYIMTVVNKLYVQQGNAICLEYTDTIKKYYGSEVEIFDFKKEKEVCRTTINEWVEAQTGNKIKNVIPAIYDEMSMIVVNAIYFKGKWMNKFCPEKTKKERFYVNENDTVEVDMMNRPGTYNARFDTKLGVHVVELPYVEKYFSMFIFVQLKEKDELSKLEAELTPGTLTHLMNGIYPSSLDFYLPRFKVEHQFFGQKMLAALDMRDLFNPIKANLAGISSTQSMFISEVTQKVYLEVNEEGCEKNTSFFFGGLGGYTKVIANHPFLFTIRDNRSGAMLFMGRVNNPNACISY